MKVLKGSFKAIFDHLYWTVYINTYADNYGVGDGSGYGSHSHEQAGLSRNSENFDEA